MEQTARGEEMGAGMAKGAERETPQHRSIPASAHRHSDNSRQREMNMLRTPSRQLEALGEET